MDERFEWKIQNLECYPSKNGLENVVFNIHWKLIFTKNNLSVSTYGSKTTGDVDASKFIPLQSLTESDVVSWLISSLGDEVEYFEEILKIKIDDIESPKSISIIPEWAKEGDQDGK